MLPNRTKRSSRRAILLLLLVALYYVATQIHFAKGAYTDRPKAKYDMKDVFVYDKKLIVEGKEFYIKGFNYSPQEIGKQNDGGFCSLKMQPDGQFRSACQFEDYFDGVEHDNGGRPKPNGPWWKPIWDRDLPKIKSTGANTIRVYHMASETRALYDKYQYPNVRKQYAAVHKPFLDACKQYGLKAIIPIVSEETIIVYNSQDELQRFIEARVDEIGNHDALIAFKIGNELGIHNKPKFRIAINHLARYVREYMLKKWNRIIPITTAEIDLPPSYAPLAAEMELEFFTSNAGYRDVFIGGLWDKDSNPANNFEGWAALTEKWDMPVLVGEYGMHDQDRMTEGRKDWINQQYRSFTLRKKDGCLGGLFFEFNEEALKPEGQKDMGVVRRVVSTDPATGKKGNEPGVFVPDTIIEKPYVFQAISVGLPDSQYKEWNYQNSEYTLTNTVQLVVDLDKITPKPFPYRGELKPYPQFLDNPPPPTPPPPPATPSPGTPPAPVPSPGTPPAPVPSPSIPAPQESNNPPPPSSSPGTPSPPPPVRSSPSYPPVPRESNDPIQQPSVGESVIAPRDSNTSATFSLSMMVISVALILVSIALFMH